MKHSQALRPETINELAQSLKGRPVLDLVGLEGDTRLSAGASTEVVARATGCSAQAVALWESKSMCPRGNLGLRYIATLLLLQDQMVQPVPS